MGGTCSTHGIRKSLRRPRRKWKDRIIMDLRETEWEDVDPKTMEIGRILSITFS